MAPNKNKKNMKKPNAVDSNAGFLFTVFRISCPRADLVSTGQSPSAEWQMLDSLGARYAHPFAENGRKCGL